MLYNLHQRSIHVLFVEDSNRSQLYINLYIVVLIVEGCILLVDSNIISYLRGCVLISISD